MDNKKKQNKVMSKVVQAGWSRLKLRKRNKVASKTPQMMPLKIHQMILILMINSR